MPKLYSARIIISALHRAGFNLVSQKGSHVKLAKLSSGQILTVIVPNHKEVALGTFQSILRQSALTKIEFDKFVK